MCAVLLPDLWPSVQQCNRLILNAQHVKTADLCEALKLLARLAKLKWKQRCYVSVQSGLLPVFRHAFVVTETIKDAWQWLARMHPDVSVLEGNGKKCGSGAPECERLLNHGGATGPVQSRRWVTEGSSSASSASMLSVWVTGLPRRSRCFSLGQEASGWRSARAEISGRLS